MHAKTDSDVSSLAGSSPARSPRHPPYYVMSPSQQDVEKMSLAESSPDASPQHRFAGSPILHHSRESSTTRFSASLKHNISWRKLPHYSPHPSSHSHLGSADDDDASYYADSTMSAKCYAALFVIGFAFIFSLFSLILWAASQAYKPKLSIKSVVIENYNVQAGMDLTGVPTEMLSIKSTVRIAFRNPATFFGVHVSSSPLELSYYGLKIASGHMAEFYQSRKSGRVVTAEVRGTQVPLYGGGSSLTSRAAGGEAVQVPLNLTFVVRARANVLGKLVKPKFYRHVRCSLILTESGLGKPVPLTRNACQYHD
ncbi:hypothetical protein J5N97_022682 [Dioscorea zingiberensis]|uniref:Late embryogenesis abundant protein LEA-2 subgroup domain-containing protein n=1 Tax=Dioscorea zingiberensis TaxID=325984 RepID=A0A9D5CCE5_9LILI|nr:hypothetical protein J5N97_022682 [Dioscorea zingiberensis]